MVVQITDLDHYGRGIARIDNKITFIPNSIPGEIVDIKITTTKKNFMEGKIIKFIEKSPIRVDNLCPYYPKCGGCQLLHLPYKEQLEYKEKKIINIFKRYGINTKIKPIIGSPSKLNYRNKVTFHCQQNKLGFYQDSSNNFIEIKNCILLNDNINKNLNSIPFGSDKIIIRSNNKELLYEKNKKIIHTIDDYNFLVSIESFFQINDYVTPLLYNKVKEYLKPQKTDTILDLYCGTGTIGIFISNQVKKVIGIEINEQAIKDAKENAKLNIVKNIEFICGDAGLESQKLNIKPNSIIIDPPRAGLNVETINTILKFNPNKIIYVSCDPMTLVRDLNRLKEYYFIDEITPFDMFPNTYHVECCVSLTKKT